MGVKPLSLQGRGSSQYPNEKVMAFYSNDTLKQFQEIHGEVLSKRKYNYKVLPSGSTECSPTGIHIGNHFVISAKVWVQVVSTDAQRGLLENVTVNLPFEYSYHQFNSVARRNYRPSPRHEVFLNNYSYSYRQPNFSSICDLLVKKFYLPIDTAFNFTEGTYRRDGCYHNRIVGVVVRLTQESERLYHIDHMLDLLE